MGQSGVGGVILIRIWAVVVKARLKAFRKLLDDDLKFSEELIVFIGAFASNGENFHGSIRNWIDLSSLDISLSVEVD